MQLELTHTENLLLACADPRHDRKQLRGLIARDIDWPAFLDEARAHRLLPLTYRHFASLHDTSIPDEVMSTLKAAYTSSAVRMEFLRARLADAETLLCNASVRHVPWKGPDLACAVYEDPATRPADDLDFLVHPDDMNAAIDSFNNAGFNPIRPMTDNTRHRYLEAGYEYIITPPDGDIHIELSTRPFPPPSPLSGDARAIWEADSGTLTPERYFLYLCMHGAKHCWDRLIWISDIACFLAANPQLDFEAISRLSHELHADRMVASALELMNRTGSDIYTPIDAGEPIPTDQLIAFSLRSHDLTTVRELRSRLKVYSRRSDACSHLIRWLFAPTYSDWEWIDLPRSASALYWFVRPLRRLASVKR